MPADDRPDLAILYVEDDPVTREELAQILRRRAREVLVAENGREGLGLFRQFSPDLVVTDIRMPEMDGLQMAQAMREKSQGIKIIATTAYSETSYLLQAIEAGIDHYVLKPVDIEKFIAAVEKCSRDILARKAVTRHHREREELLAKLQAALEEIKVLQGILPICSFCKNIRNDEGYWEQVEAYIGRHTKAEFSHSVCPACLRKHYPEHYEKIMAQRRQENPQQE